MSYKFTKIYSFISLIFILISLNSESKAQISVGLNSSVVFSGGLFEPALVSRDILTGYSGGIMFRHINEKYTGLQIECVYNHRGWYEGFDTLDLSYKRYINNIDLNFFAHLHFGKKRSNIIINGGPVVNYVLGEEIQSNNTDIELSGFTAYNYKIYNNLGFGIGGGLGYQYTLKKSGFSLEARGTYFLSDLFFYNADEYTQSQLYSIQIVVSYFYTF